MAPQEIKALFPINVKIDPFHRDLAIEKGGLHKLGNILLMCNIPQILHENIFWGLSIGSVKGVLIKTEYEEIVKDKKVKLPLYLDQNFIGNEVIFELR